MKTPNYKKFFDIKKILADVRKYLPNINEQRFLKAFEVAEQAHRGQMRKDGVTPYIAHPVAAIKILSSLHADEDTLISCLLHDVAEDTDFTIEEIENIFGSKVAFLVNGVTKLSKVNYDKKMSNAKVASLRKLLLHSAKDLRVIVIKLADRLHNMSTLQNVQKAEKRVKKATETLEIYVPIADLLGMRQVKSQLEDYCFKHLFPTEYEKLSSQLEKHEDLLELYFKEFEKVIKKMARDSHIKGTVTRKKQSLYKVYKKICAIGRPIEEVQQRIAVRIVVDTPDQCYQMLGAIHMRFAPLTQRFKDYIANPKANGYRSIHTSVFGVDGVLTEVQIMTKEMAMDADHGVAVNFFTRNSIEGSHPSKDAWLKQVIEIEQSFGTHSNSFLEGLKADILRERIVVLTPKGKGVNLPKDSTVIDFAYAIHSKLGDKASKAEINGKLMPISTPLKTRDVVRVVTDESANPDLAWLSFARTNHARKLIRKALRKISEEKKVKKGKRILVKHVKVAGHSFGTRYGWLLKKINRNTSLTLGSKKDLYIALAQGDIQPKFITGLLSRRRKLVSLSDSRVHLQLFMKNRPGILSDLIDVVKRYSQEVHCFKGQNVNGDKEAVCTIELSMKDESELARLFADFSQVEEITRVYRLPTRAFSATVGSLVWLSILTLGTLVLMDRFSSVFVYIAIGMIFASTMVLNHVLKRMFPVLKSKKRFWFFSFLIPAFATLLIEIRAVSSGLELNYYWIGGLLMFTYLYVAMLMYLTRRT